MMQKIKTDEATVEAKRKLAFLRNRKMSSLQWSHRHSKVRNLQYKDRSASLEDRGLPKFGVINGGD